MVPGCTVAQCMRRPTSGGFPGWEGGWVGSPIIIVVSVASHPLEMTQQAQPGHHFHHALRSCRAERHNHNMASPQDKNNSDLENIYSDDDDDDDDVDLSAYDVSDYGIAAAQPEPLPPSPAAPPMPKIGSTVLACFSRRWLPARVVDADPVSRVLSVTFPGYNDIVPLAHDRWEAKSSGGRGSDSGGTSLGKRERDDSDKRDAAAHDELSEREREMLRRCEAVRNESLGSTEAAEASASIPGAPLDAANRGHRLLQRMGWREGEGLGANSEGDVRSVAEDLPVQHSRVGLGGRGHRR